MPRARWYLQRLGAMGPREIPWRAWRMGRTQLGAWRPWPAASTVDCRQIWSGSCSSDALRGLDQSFPNHPDAGDLARWPPHWRERCLADAERLLEHRFGFFHLDDQWFGEHIDWQRDYASGKRVSLRYSGGLDYRDANRVGDVKVIWELSRMQHLTRLAQAWRWTRDARFPAEIVDQIRDWIGSNPWMMGLNWTSPMECALRLLTWTCTFHLIRDWEGLSDGFCRVLVASIDQHLRTIDRSYSLFSSANNHLIAEACGAYVGAGYWRGLKSAVRWRRRARAHLVRECLRQNTRDGVNKEHSFAYQCFVWELLVLPAVAGHAWGDEFPEEYWTRLRRMVEFLAWVSDQKGNTPNVGDQDDGKVLNLSGDGKRPIGEMLAMAGILFGRADFSRWGGKTPSEKAAWIIGSHNELEDQKGQSPLPRTSRSFKEGGYHVFRAKDQSAEEEVLLLFDVAPNGDAVTGVHGHADALSVILHLGGQPFFCDPGTFSYQDTRYRHYFRATAQHNTLVFGEDDQSEYVNRFQWGKRELVELQQSQLTDNGGFVSGSVRWWTGAYHERQVECDFFSRHMVLRDSWSASKPARLNFSVDPGIRVSVTGPRSCKLIGEGVTLFVECDNGSLKVGEMDFSSCCYQQEKTFRIIIDLSEVVGDCVTKCRWSFNDVSR